MLNIIKNNEIIHKVDFKKNPLNSEQSQLFKEAFSNCEMIKYEIVFVEGTPVHKSYHFNSIMSGDIKELNITIK